MEVVPIGVRRQQHLATVEIHLFQRLFDVLYDPLSDLLTAPVVDVAAPRLEMASRKGTPVAT